MKAEYAVGAVILGAVVIGLAFLFASPTGNIQVNEYPQTQVNESYKEILNPAGFVNTEPITLSKLVGQKVILVDFMTYSCINCQRTFPYLNAWYKTYKNSGLEIVGIHTPEFAFEKDIDNVRRAMREFGIMYPVVLDNDYDTWSAYGNRYWPRKYLIDIHGRIVYDHIGEGAYEETEMKIQELLRERADFLREAVELGGENVAATMPAQENSSQSPETYFGSLRNVNFGNGIPGESGEKKFVLPKELSLNILYFGGTWNVQPEFAEAVRDAQAIFRYNAREVFLVMDAEERIEIEIWQDGKQVSLEAGADVRDGVVSVKDSRLYKLIKNSEAGEHVLELKVRDSGARLYAFTFG